ncbi:MAG: helix-turn-helix domain-containing protein [Luteolibacter sp.]
MRARYAKDLASPAELTSQIFSVKTEFSEKLAVAIAKSGKSKGSLADCCGVALSTVSRWLGGAIPKAETISKISEFLSVDANWLLSARNEPGYPDSLHPDLEVEEMENLLWAVSATLQDHKDATRKEQMILLEPSAYKDQIRTLIEALRDTRRTNLGAQDELVKLARRTANPELRKEMVSQINLIDSKAPIPGVIRGLEDAILLREMAESSAAAMRILKKQGPRPDSPPPTT